jgi:ATPase subunit of ABC transporter with duplicated ATPase domains
VVQSGKKTKIAYLPQILSGEEAMSGGELAKRILAPIIASDANVFLLDEPTNNLDVEGLEMIEKFISKSASAFLIISHDRMFLDRTVTKIIEIDAETKTSQIFDGNYSEYQTERTHMIERQWKQYADKVERLESMNEVLEDKLSYVDKIEKRRKSIKFMPIHDRNKPNAAVLRDKEARAAKRAKVFKKRIERYKESTDNITKPTYFLPLHIRLDHERGGDKVFNLKEVVKKRKGKDVGPFTFRVNYGDRLQIAGSNGAGKTTLIKMLVGELAADMGMIERGENVSIGYIPQERWYTRTRQTVTGDFLSHVPDIEEGNARKILNRFRITAEDVVKQVHELSPGEYSRLILAELLALRPNCIILDEPTNHLDLEVLEELEEGLREYTGTLIVVSHDRYFVQKLGMTRILDLDKTVS